MLTMEAGSFSQVHRIENSPGIPTPIGTSQPSVLASAYQSSACSDASKWLATAHVACTQDQMADPMNTRIERTANTSAAKSAIGDRRGFGEEVTLPLQQHGKSPTPSVLGAAGARQLRPPGSGPCRSRGSMWIVGARTG